MAPPPWARAVFVLLLVAALALGAAALGAPGPARFAAGGAPGRRARPDPARSPHLVVDTLNLAHWLRGRAPGAGRLGPDAVAEAIALAAPRLAARHPGRVYFVVKDRESAFNSPETHAAFQEAAKKFRVYVAVAERYADPPRGVPLSAEHSARGRDDFLLAFLAARLGCAALTEDRFRDFARFRATLQPFHYYEFAPWGLRPSRDFLRPEAPAFAGLRPPRGLRFAAYFPELAGAPSPPLSSPPLSSPPLSSESSSSSKWASTSCATPRS